MQLQPGVFRLNPILLSLGLIALPGLAQAEAPKANETLVVTATQTKHTELSAPASVSVVTRADLDKMNASTLADAIKGVTGVHIYPGNTNGRQEIRLRGLESDYTLLLVNGRRINSREALTSGYANDFDVSTIPVAAIERIEVLRGPISSLYGADALGGVVNVILRKPTEETKGSAAYTFSSPTDGHNGDANKGSGYLSGSLIDNKLLGNVIVEGLHRDAWQSEQSINPNTDAIEKREKWSAITNLTWLIDQDQELELGAIFAKDDRLARWNNYGATVLNDQQMERLNLNLTHNGRWKWFDSRVGYNFEQVDLRDDSQLMTTLNKKIGEVTQNNHTFDGQVTTSAGWNLITAGAEYRITELEHNVSLNGKKTSVDQYALYLQDELDLGPLNLTLSGRMDDHETYGSEFSPRAYALYNMNDNWVFKGGVGRAFKAPTISQTDADYGVLACRGACTIVGNPDLQPETAVSYEYGTAYEATGFGAGITAFNNDIKNKIQSDSWRVGHRPKVMTYSNVAEARIRGVEINGWVDITDDLNISANGTILDGKDMTTGLDLYKTPEHLFNAKLEWQTLDTLSTRVGWNYVGSQTIPVPRMTGATYERSEGYHTFDLGFVWNALPKLDVKTGLNNLTNTKRDQIATDADLILEGRTIYAGLEYKL
ncbi:TonB-dependent receptor domain-containing protein [Aeromonas dhakensis]|uniref:TonB-dependent receptor domain-containing protein n=1 Tax=Aeromonas dhakensis TaxID=196024 RepID=UPI00208FAECE|nr:TonB-dependent receptor [Aeromonas dhakensis]USP08139.1 TonB-dependent receptor [Aeromonas dhakensis]